MTITITTAGPHNIAGPGIPIRLHSDATRPVGPQIQWTLNWFTVGGPFLAFHSDSFLAPSSVFDQVVVPWTSPINPTINVHEGMPVTDDTVSLQVSLNRLDNGIAIDTGSASVSWDAQSGLANQQIMTESTGGGLTAGQAAQLTQIVDNTTTTKEDTGGTTNWSIGEALGAQSIDTFTALEITSGPTFGFVAHNLTAFVWGVLVRISTLAPIDVPITPDGDYFLRDLAVVRIFHGDDLYLRKPIHTSSQIVDLRQDKLSLIVTAVEVALWPNSVTLQVNFANGISGQVFLLTLP